MPHSALFVLLCGSITMSMAQIDYRAKYTLSDEASLPVGHPLCRLAGVWSVNALTIERSPQL